MAVQPINQNLAVSKRNNQNNQQSFTGSFNPIVALMDGIEKGGFAASFIAQDGIGMVAPRISEGLNRNRKVDENGKKTGPLNWEFARREGIREILSGPSAFLIPLGILSVIKKTSGPANNVHVNHINVLGQNLADYVANNPSDLNNLNKLKRGYYSRVFENVFANSTEDFNEVKQTAQHFANRLVDAENKKGKAAKEIYNTLTQEYMDIRKGHTAASSSELGVVIQNGEDTLNTNFRRLIQSLTDYSNDALNKTTKYLRNNANGDAAEFIKKFTHHRAGTRVLTNLGMWGAVVGFYTLIPKLYNMGIKHDPGLKGLVDDNKEAKKGKNPPFTGLADKAAKLASGKGKAGKILGNFEFNGASMSVPAMLTLLFGFCLPPRYINAKSDKERKEILVRDITSFVSILFGAKALSRGFSKIFAKISGLALNIQPKAQSNGIFTKLKNYFSPGQGIEVLTSEQIVSKYSQVDKYKDGIVGFFNFIQENGGNVKKVLNIDDTVKQNAEVLVKQFNNGKSLKESTTEEIISAFKKAMRTESAGERLDSIYKQFALSDNKFINRAKTYNSMFGFVSTILLVPIFMMWLARYCERMTKNAIAKEQAQKAASETNIQPNTTSMNEFLNK